MPTSRVLLGNRLKAVRTAAGLRQADVADVLGIAQSRVSGTEKGDRRAPSPDELRVWLTACRVPEAEWQPILDLGESAVGGDVTQWEDLKQVGWTRHQQRYGDLQDEASEVLLYQPSLIPGLLQTPAYVEYLMRYVVRVSAKEIPDAIAGRLGRQEWLHAPSARLRVIIAEHVLRTPFGGRTVMVGQLDRLASAAHLPSVDLAVLPTDSGIPEAWGVGFTMYEMPDQADSQVLVELPSGEVRETDAAHVARYRERFALYTEYAVAGEGAIQIVQGIAAGMRRPRGDTRHAAPGQTTEGIETEDS